ncbi:MAG: restriction endonuclease subunit S [Muribaculaceae bacterium]|nr:restriction endonuclease subunit S [Muribaculaceae bacterium]
MREWQDCRIKDAVSLVSVKSEDLSLPYIALDNIVSWDAKFIPSDSASDGNSNECVAGDILFGKLRPYLAKAYIPTEKSICSPEFLVMRSNNGTHNKFMLYYFLSKSFISHIRNQVAGTKMPRTKWSDLGSMSFSLPPIAEQEAIAAYLDKECEKIGREIDLLERKADAYSRLRRSLINRAVTRGINPNASLKQSGLRWITRIPEYWEIGRIRNYFNFRNEKVSEIDFAPLSVTKNGVVPQMENVAKSMAEGETRKKVCKYDFVVNSRSDRKGSCGTSPLDGSVSLIYIVLEPKRIDPQFADYYFRCNDWVEEFYRNGKGIVADLWTTNYSIMRNIEIALPPYQEQREIVAYLDEKCGKIDAIIEKIATKIERLKELKRSLINEVVTGKRAITTCNHE